MENRPVDPGSIQGSHRPISFMIKHRTRADDILCKTESYRMFSSQKPYYTNVSDVPRSLQNWVSTIQTGRTQTYLWQWKRDVFRPMTMETRCSKVIFPKYSTKETGWRYARTAAMGNTGEKKMFVFLGLFFRAAVLVRGGTCAFTLKIVNTLIKNSSRDD